MMEDCLEHMRLRKHFLEYKKSRGYLGGNLEGQILELGDKEKFAAKFDNKDKADVPRCYK